MFLHGKRKNEKKGRTTAGYAPEKSFDGGSESAVRSG